MVRTKHSNLGYSEWGKPITSWTFHRVIFTVGTKLISLGFFYSQGENDIFTVLETALNFFSFKKTFTVIAEQFFKGMKQHVKASNCAVQKNVP